MNILKKLIEKYKNFLYERDTNKFFDELIEAYKKRDKRNK